MKKVLKWLNVYYPLQGFYRRSVFNCKKIFLQLKYSKYKGAGYTCNYCGATYTRFAPWYPEKKNAEAIAKNNVVAGYGENIFCPSCLSTARERLLKAMTIDNVNVNNRKILHLSPERNFYQFIKTKGTVVSADYFPRFYTRVDRSVQFADATNLPYENESFDIVIGNHIMEHIPDDLAAMKEIYRVIKPGGEAILQVPFSVSIDHTIEEPDINNQAKQSALFGQQDHVRIYALDDYLSRLKETGFTVNYLSYESLSRFYLYAIQKEEGFISIKK